MEAKLSNIKTELLEATLQLDRDQLASEKSTTYAQKVKNMPQKYMINSKQSKRLASHFRSMS